MSIKKIAAAAALVVAAAPSFALITTGTSGDSELFLVVYGTKATAADSDASYTLDLGITEKSFLATPSLSATLSGANWAAFTSTIDLSTAKWAVMGEDNTGTTSGTRNLLTTVQVGNEGAAGTLTSAKLTNANTAIDAFMQEANQTGTHVNLANGDSFNKVGGLGYFMTSNGNVLNNQITFDNSNLIGVGSEFTNLVRTSGTSPVAETVLAGTMNFKQVGAAYVLSYDVPVAEVPEPSGVALALTALGVLGFIGRRRKED